jgi:hypothetical protein
VYVRLPEFDFIDDKEGKPVGMTRLDHSPDLPPESSGPIRGRCSA